MQRKPVDFVLAAAETVKSQHLCNKMEVRIWPLGPYQPLSGDVLGCKHDIGAEGGS